MSTLRGWVSFLAGLHTRCGASSVLSCLPMEVARQIVCSLDGEEKEERSIFIDTHTKITRHGIVHFVVECYEHSDLDYEIDMNLNIGKRRRTYTLDYWPMFPDESGKFIIIRHDSTITTMLPRNPTVLFPEEGADYYRKLRSDVITGYAPHPEEEKKKRVIFEILRERRTDKVVEIGGSITQGHNQITITTPIPRYPGSERIVLRQGLYRDTLNSTAFYKKQFQAHFIKHLRALPRYLTAPLFDSLKQ